MTNGREAAATAGAGDGADAAAAAQEPTGRLARYRSLLLGLAGRFLLAAVSVEVGEVLVRGVMQLGEDAGLGFWGVVRNALDWRLYPDALIAEFCVVVGAVLLSDLVTPRRINLAGLALCAAFAGAWLHVMIIYDFQLNLEDATRSFEASLPPALGAVFSLTCLLLVFFAPCLLLVALKTFVPPLRRRQMTRA